MKREEYLLKSFIDNEEYIKKRSKEGIDNYRKGLGKILVVDKTGLPVGNAHILITQKSHDFKYGANLFMLDEFENKEKNAIYRELFSNYFNIATLPFYWDDLEPIEGKPRFASGSSKVYRRPSPDLCVEFCEENGITPKAHCLNYDRDTPKWLQKYNAIEQWKILERRINECAERYKNCIPYWEVTNETFWQEAKSLIYYDREYVERSFGIARKYFQSNRLIINEDQTIFRNPFLGDRANYFMQVERALLKGAPIDIIGFQYHQLVGAEEEELWIGGMFDPIRIYNVFDTFDALGKNYQMTEITIPCFDPKSIEAEQLQAELIKRLYTLWFGIPNMEAIIYWNAVDGYAYMAEPGDFTAGQNRLAGGLLRFDLTPKPALQVIEKLFQKEWHTETEIITKADGTAMFRGFYGEYEISVTANGKNEKITAKLSKNGSKEIKIRI